MSKLTELAQLEGYRNSTDMLTSIGLDATVPAICVNPSCNHHEQMEPDQTGGYCPLCKDYTVTSCLVLAGMI